MKGVVPVRRYWLAIVLGLVGFLINMAMSPYAVSLGGSINGRPVPSTGPHFVPALFWQALGYSVETGIMFALAGLAVAFILNRRRRAVHGN